MGNNRRNALEFLTLRESDEFHTHCHPTRLTDLGNTGANHLATAGDEHEFVFVGDGECADHESGLLAGLHGDDTFPSARLLAVILKRGALANAVIASNQKHAIIADDAGGDDIVILVRTNTPDSDRGASLVAKLFLAEADAHTLTGHKHYLVVSIGHDGGDQFVSLLDLDRDDTALADVGKVLEVRLLDDTAACCKQDVLIRVPRGVDGCNSTG